MNEVADEEFLSYDQEEDYTFVCCKKRIDEGYEKLLKYISDVNEDEVETYVSEEIKVCGNRNIFVIVDKNLREGVIEFSLLKELCALYKWRRKFFDEHLPVLKGSWFTNSFCRDVITFQITRNFDQILRIASSRLLPSGKYPEGIFLESDGDISRNLRFRIDNLEILYHLKEVTLWKYYFLTEKFLPGSHLMYSDVAKIIFEHYLKSPRKLEELASICAKRNNISFSDCSRNVVTNERVGFYFPLDNIDGVLSNEGVELFSLLNEISSKIRNTSSSSLSDEIED